MLGPNPMHRGGFVLALSLACLAPGTADADKYFGLGGGAMVPYTGSTGWTVVMEMGTDWTNEHVRVGGELVFADLDRTVNLTSVGAGVIPIDMKTYEARFVTRYVMFPGKITPYFGVGGGFMVIHLDDSGLAQAVGVPGLVRGNSKIGFAGGLNGHVGLEIPMFSKALNLFGEARAKYDWEFTNNTGPVAGPSNWNGFSGVAGVRGRF